MRDPNVARLTESHRQAQIALGNGVAKDLAKAWRLLNVNDLDGTFPRYLAAAMPIIQARRAGSSIVAARYFSASRAAQGAEGEPPSLAERASSQALATSLAVTGPITAKSAIGRGATPAEAMSRAFVATSGSAKRHVLNGGRETIIGAARADRAPWQRISDGSPCPFCAMLVSRGPVYSEQTADFDSHDRCGCAAEPFYGDPYDRSLWTPQARQYREIWDKHAKGFASDGTSLRKFSEALKGTTTRPPLPPVTPKVPPIAPKVADTVAAVEQTVASTTTGRAGLLDLSGKAPAMDSRILKDWKGVAPEVAAESEDTLARLMAEYPEVATQIDFVGSSAAAKRLWRVRSGGGGKTFAWTLRPQATRGSPLAVSAVTKPKVAALRADLARNAESGWLSKGSGTVRGVVTHEFGHQVFFAISQSPARTAAWEFAVAKRLGLTIEPGSASYANGLGKLLAQRTGEISKYARTNADERFAEAFASVRFDPNAPELARILVEEAERVIREVPK